MQMNEIKFEHWPTSRLTPYARNPRKNDHVVDQMAAAITEFGFRIPIIARSTGEVVDGHLRLKAALRLGLETVPVILADDLTPAQIKAFRIRPTARPPGQTGTRTCCVSNSKNSS